VLRRLNTHSAGKFQILSQSVGSALAIVLSACQLAQKTCNFFKIASKMIATSTNTLDLKQLVFFFLGILFAFSTMGGSFCLFSESTSKSPLILSGQEEGATAPLLGFSPSTKDVVINIGSNLDPIMPAKELGPCARAIAIEPVVGCQIPPHPQLNIISAAVAGESGVMSMRIYNHNGVSSSLAKPAQEDFWNKGGKGDNGKLVLAPVITLSSLLRSIPAFTKVSVLMTDIQGFDFAAIKEGASVLKEKVTHLVTEVWKDDKYTYDAQNDFCRDWMPFMKKLGELPFGLVPKFLHITLIQSHFFSNFIQVILSLKRSIISKTESPPPNTVKNGCWTIPRDPVQKSHPV